MEARRSHFVASMELSLKVILELDIEIRILQFEWADRQKSF